MPKKFEFSERINKLPPYLFAAIEQKVEEKRKKGVDVISLGIGDPDLPADKSITDALCAALKDKDTHRYSSSAGEGWYREAVARWFDARFGVKLDPAKEVACVIGSKEGISNFARAVVGIGDEVLAPNPGYPVYSAGASVLCDGKSLDVPLLEENDFLIDIPKLPKGKKLLFANYPNNPIGATADSTFMKELSDFVDDANGKTILTYDNAYSEMTFDGYVAPSMLEYNRDVIEFHSLSKTFNMTGFRIGFAVGNADLIGALKKTKSQIDSGAPIFVQKAAIAALESYKGGKRPKFVNDAIKIFEERRDVCVAALKDMGLSSNKPKGTFYIWVTVDKNKKPGSSVKFADKALDAGVVVTPGVGFGKYGEGYVRIAITQSKERIIEAMERLKMAADA